jgi:hypothetical protein
MINEKYVFHQWMQSITFSSVSVSSGKKLVGTYVTQSNILCEITTEPYAFFHYSVSDLASRDHACVLLGN